MKDDWTNSTQTIFCSYFARNQISQGMQQEVFEQQYYADDPSNHHIKFKIFWSTANILL